MEHWSRDLAPSPASTTKRAASTLSPLSFKSTMSGADAPPTTAQLHASINFQFKQIDVTATESPSLRKAVKEKYTERAALVQLADNTWVKSMAVRRATKENNKYMLTIGVAPGAKGAHVPPPLVLQEIEDGTLWPHRRSSR